MSFDFKEQISKLERLEKEVLESGKKNGLDEVPASSDVNFNAAQLDIKFDCQKVARELISDTKKNVLEYSNTLSTYEDHISDDAILPDVGNIKKETEHNVKGFLVSQEQSYVTAKYEYLKAEKSLKKFTMEKGITHESDAPPSKTAHYQTIIAFAVLESIVNIFIFNNGFSIPEAVFLSVAISIINIAPAVAVGNYFRNSNSDNSNLKRNAYVLLAGWMVFVVWLNTSIAIYRSSVPINANESADAVAHHGQIFFNSALSVFMLRTPPIDDIVSILLWILGILFGLFACWKGYKSDDRIPEYGSKVQTYRETKFIYDNLIHTINDHTRSMIESQNQSFKRLKEELDRNQRDYKAVITLIRSKIINFETNLQEIRNQYSRMINLYRDGNKSTRLSRPPEYFADVNPDLSIDQEIPNFEEFSGKLLEERHLGLKSSYIQKVSEINSRIEEFHLFTDELNEYVRSSLDKWDEVTANKFEEGF